MKPVKQDKLFAVLDRAVASLQKTERVILLPVGGEMLRLPISQVQYVEAFSHTELLHRSAMDFTQRRVDG